MHRSACRPGHRTLPLHMCGLCLQMAWRLRGTDCSGTGRSQCQLLLVQRGVHPGADGARCGVMPEMSIPAAPGAADGAPHHSRALPQSARIRLADNRLPVRRAAKGTNAPQRCALRRQRDQRTVGVGDGITLTVPNRRCRSVASAADPGILVLYTQSVLLRFPSRRRF